MKILLVLGAVLSAASDGSFERELAMEMDDDCSSSSAQEECALRALQLNGKMGPRELEADKDAGNLINEWIGSRGIKGAAEDMLEEAKLGAGPDPYVPAWSGTSDLKVQAKQGIAPPRNATQYNGIAWPEMTFPGTGEMHVYTIGDWGGILWEQWGSGEGLHVMPYVRPGCGMAAMKVCFHQLPGDCSPACGYWEGVDNNAQVVVADQMKKRAEKTGVQYILNVGDNFYPLGLNAACGREMDQITDATKMQFQKAFDWVYSGALQGKPWLSVLGNHDYGGRQYNHAWDQQIAFTWASDRWVMPAQYFSQHVKYPDQDFSVDIYMLDSNVNDARDAWNPAGDNLCNQRYTQSGDCSRNGGPANSGECLRWFQDLWGKQTAWMEEKLKASTADWQIAVTHFQCGRNGAWYGKLRRELGLDLLVTGHVHEQQLHFLGWGLTCIVTGGGGGITSERTPQGNFSKEYGFFDITLSKSAMKLELVNFLGNVAQTHTVSPQAALGSSGNVAAPPQNIPAAPAGSASAAPAEGISAACSANPGCAHLHGNCCPAPSGMRLGCCR